MKNQIKTGPLYRELEIQREAINENERTVELSFSSETPIERWFGYEILSHDTGAVRLARLNNGAPLLLNHSSDRQIGVVEKVWIQDRRGKAVVRFSRSALAGEVFQDVLDGIRRKVSVGYRIHQMVDETEQGAESETYRATDWEPYEVSIVPMPADDSVGIGRGVDETTITIVKKEELCANDSVYFSTKTMEAVEAVAKMLPLIP